ncbi:MAG: RNA polymerase sigma factor [Clostridia bacterium]|nr:RNA polymerase sigma factor [Clostridia bacterium]
MDRITFQTNVLTCEEMLYRVAKSICFYESDCEDAVQEAILKAYEKLGSLKNEKYFKTWLTRILINECYKINRIKSRQVSFDDYLFFEEAREPENSYVYEAIMHLPEKIRVVVQLYYVEGYSVDETASILRIPSGTVKSRLSQGRKSLKTILEE